MSGVSTRRRERGASPDSTTQIIQLQVGDEVLSRGKDGVYYCGTIEYIDEETDAVKVKFDDCSVNWSLKKDITNLKSVNERRCSVCDSSCASLNNTFVICSKCSTPYHQHCHQPKIYSSTQTKDWMCKKCECDPKVNAKKGTQLPYDLQALTWDGKHRVNEEQLYCYCGGPGEWYRKMVQCRRCRQWFHEVCIANQELLLGDGLYVFVCSVCNEGEQFIHRLELRWEDIVHLVMYNLTVINSYQFHDLHRSIIVYMNENWDKIQPPLAIYNSSNEKRIEMVEHVLQTRKTRYMCGREKHKKNSIWALRNTEEVPPIPTVILPPGKITEALVPKFKIYNGRLSSPELADSESEDSLEESSDEEVYAPKRKAKDRKKAKDIEKLLTMPTPPSARQKLRPRPDNSDQSEASSHKPLTNGQPAMKRRRKLFDNKGGDSDSYSETVRITNDKRVIRIRRKRRREESTEKNGGIRRVTKKRDSESSDVETSSRGTLDSYIPAPMDFEGRNNPFRALIEPCRTVAMKSVKRPSCEEQQRRRRKSTSELQPATKYASPSPADESPPSCSLEFLHDRKCSVNNLFGASNRISCGESFNVLAKRICTETGRIQYLIEWESA